MHGPPNNILIIRLSSVGDIVLSSTLIRVLRQRFPESRIDYLVKAEYADLVRHNPNLSRVIEFPAQSRFADLRALRAQLRSSGYDTVLDIHDSLRSRYLCFGLARVSRINKRKLPRWLLIHTKVNMYRHFGGAPSVAERYIETAHTLGAMNDGGGLELFLPDSAVQTVGAWLSREQIDTRRLIIGICPSAKHGNKMWPVEQYAASGSDLAATADASIVILGSHEEIARCSKLEHLLQERDATLRILNTAGTLSLLEAAALLDKCAVVLTNDSGLMHIAAARKRPVVAVFGPTVAEFGFHPVGTRSAVIEQPGLSCRPCTHIGLPSCPKGHFRCMTDIEPARVTKAALAFLRT